MALPVPCFPPALTIGACRLVSLLRVKGDNLNDFSSRKSLNRALSRIFKMHLKWSCMLLLITLYERCVAQRCLSIGKKTAVVLVSGILSLTHPISPYSIASNSIALPFPLIESVSAISDDNGGISRMRKAREELSSLKKDWMEVVTTKGGDGVRKRLGTVYKPPACELSLCSFPSFVERFIQNNPDLDIDAIEEPARLLSEAYTQSDFYAYSSNFAEFGNGGGLYGSSPNSDAYLDKSRAQIERALAALDECLRVIDKR